MTIFRKVKQNVLLATVAFLMVFLLAVNTEAAEKKGTISFSVEKFTIGQGYLIEPCQVTITEGEKLSTVAERVLKEKGYQYDAGIGTWGWYLSGIKNADSRKVAVPSCVKPLLYDVPLTEVDNNDLEGADYASYSGWMFYQNNESLNVAADSAYVHDGDVIRFRFSLTGGTDLGKVSWADNFVNQPNLDEMTKRMAAYNSEKALCVEKGYQSSYNAALQFITNMDNYVIEKDDSNKAAVDAKVKALSDKLPSISQIEKWKAEKAEKETARKNTPAVPKWKSVKTKSGQKVALTWKKVSNATGYEIYMSTKKSSGYKKIAVVKDAKKVTYIKTKLKKNKKYYFKVRAYKTVGGKKYISGYSAVKSAKVK